MAEKVDLSPLWIVTCLLASWWVGVFLSKVCQKHFRGRGAQKIDDFGPIFKTRSPKFRPVGKKRAFKKTKFSIFESLCVCLKSCGWCMGLGVTVGILLTFCLNHRLWFWSVSWDQENVCLEQCQRHDVRCWEYLSEVHRSSLGWSGNSQPVKSDERK